ncbi:COQ9-domain-containing protein [Chaetomium tenue]|uniref:COQ9-domain-containing protein n=1 Tax=Chaetomium tenue TaxID=1854479 RepID=A0ACB7PN21_9PEZI|nr:COQ9-domain-containing protein [Chaetomium globosum]
MGDRGDEAPGTTFLAFHSEADKCHPQPPTEWSGQVRLSLLTPDQPKRRQRPSQCKVMREHTQRFRRLDRCWALASSLPAPSAAVSIEESMSLAWRWGLPSVTVRSSLALGVALSATTHRSVMPTTPSVPCRALSITRAQSVISLANSSRPPSLRHQPSSAPKLPAPTRTYHSHDHPPPPGPFTPSEAALLAAAYTHVPSHGFTPESLALGARDAGLLDISPSILPDGVFSLIRWHLHTQRTALADKAKDAVANEGATTVGERVEALAWARLRGNVESGVVGRWQEALAIMAQPSYIPPSAKELAQLADEILYLAGDVSVDPTWYTKRASLSAIYVGAELFQTTDQSPDYRETRAFLRRRLDEAARAGGAVRSIGEWIGFNAGAAVNVLRSKGVRI